MSATSDQIAQFITRWSASGAAERANCQPFLAELCELLGVQRPDPARPDDHENAYVFERRVVFHHGDGSTSEGRIDLYKRGCFVLEAKQGAEKIDALPALSQAAAAQQKARKRGTATRATPAWDAAMQKARNQAERYARALPASEGRPPLVIVVDVGHSIEVYSEFTRTGGAYVPFPDPRTHRILLPALKEETVRERLRLAWTDPMALDPSRKSARVTRDIADKLARLAKSLEADGHRPKAVAEFLMRCLFTMFAEDVQLLPQGAFTKLLENVLKHPAKFKPAVEDLWRVMNTGGFHSGFMENILRFNGGLFATPHALEINEDQLNLLLEASRADWRDVEPAIFGTLLERALNPEERHKLGAHYTPRAYVERLVLPTIVEPLREEWANVQAEAFTLAAQDKLKAAAKAIHDFHRRLCALRVLDPACGSGNFLYVTLEHLKRLEGEIFNTLADLGEKQTLIESEGITVDPHQLLGIEINPRAAVIAELVLWIGYLQWHHRTHGDVNPPEPIIRNFKNIECRDAVLAYDKEEIVIDPATLKPVTRWDGRTTKKHPVTGEDVPDESARIPVYRYLNPRPAEWPQADFVVGNPPFIGVRKLKDTIGQDYVDALRAAYPIVPATADYVMYWWHVAATKISSRRLNRFGLITTNSVVQAYSRPVLTMHLDGAEPNVRLAFAVADHPWVQAEDGAAVRISMTVGEARGMGNKPAVICQIIDDDNAELATMDCQRIGSNLTPHSHARIFPLQANSGLCFQGIVPAGSGFKLTENELARYWSQANVLPTFLRPYLIGKDLVQNHQRKFIIDFFGLSDTDARHAAPELYQKLLTEVRPEREQNRRDVYRNKWWIFAEPRPALRRATANLPRFIATPYTAKHRPFCFVDASFLPDAMVYVIASGDSYVLGALSSKVFHCFALEHGGTLENRPRFNSKAVFFPFPFPDASAEQRERIRALGEQLDAHRKTRQAAHPALTMTGMYNVLEKLRTGEALSTKDRQIHDQGLVSVLKEIHDQLDAAVFEAYGWPANLSDEEILERLVALNAERAEEERQGKIRWLRPEFQCKQAGSTTAQTEAALETEDDGPGAAGTGVKQQATVSTEKRPWPETLPAQTQAIREVLAQLNRPADVNEIAKCFQRARKERIGEILETLVALGQCREGETGSYIM